MAQAARTDTGWMGKVPPHNLDAERSVLGAMILDEEACFRALEMLNTKHFYHPPHSIIFERIKELFLDKNVQADAITLTDRLKTMDELDRIGGAGYITGLMNVVPTVDNVENHARIVRDKATLRSCIRTAWKLSEMAYREDKDVDEIIEGTSSEFFELSQQREERDFESMETLAPYTLDTVKSMIGRPDMKFLATGFGEFDQKYHGFYESEYVIVAARPSVGKTSWALQVATNLAREGKGVAIFSLEMPKEQIGVRLLSAQADVPTEKVFSGKISGTEVERLTTSANIMKDWKIYIDDTPSLTPLKIRTKIRRLLMTLGDRVDIVIIDYLQLMEIDHFGRSESRVQEVTQMSRALKALARQINKPVVVLSQLSRHIERREFESRAPMLSDLRESGAIEQDADKIIFLQRVRDAQKIVDNHFEHMGQMYYVPDEDEIERPVPVWLYISKNRNGPTGKMLLGFNRQCIKFVPYDPRTSQTERYS